MDYQFVEDVNNIVDECSSKIISNLNESSGVRIYDLDPETFEEVKAQVEIPIRHALQEYNKLVNASHLTK